MNDNRQQHHGAALEDFIPKDELQKILDYAREPQTIEGKLQLFDKLTKEYPVVNPRYPNRTDRRSRAGTFINRMFNTQLELPSIGRRQQIGKAVKFAREYLIEQPQASLYFALAMGAAEEYKEWHALIGDLKPAQQMAILNSEAGESNV